MPQVPRTEGLRSIPGLGPGLAAALPSREQFDRRDAATWLDAASCNYAGGRTWPGGRGPLRPDHQLKEIHA